MSCCLYKTIIRHFAGVHWEKQHQNDVNNMVSVIIGFGHISHLTLVFLLLTLNIYSFSRIQLIIFNNSDKHGIDHSEPEADLGLL